MNSNLTVILLVLPTYTRTHYKDIFYRPIFHFFLIKAYSLQQK